MAAKSDFAQKLLNDLRLRKERMAATQNSGQQYSSQMSTDAVNHGRSYSGSRQIMPSQSASSKTGNAFRKSNSRAIGIEESSKQIVLSDRGQGLRQAGDLSTAIAFALENGGKIKIASSSNNPLVNFFNRFGRRSSVDSGKMKMNNKQSNSANQFPTVSSIHISEISKGIQKLNQILRACSNGHNLDNNSIQVGKELLKGAMDLEESLKMLVNVHEASTQQKSRIKLLDEDEEDDDNNANIVDNKVLDRPRFSFHKQEKNSYFSRGSTENEKKHQLMVLTYPTETPKQHVSGSKTGPHKRSASCLPEFDSRSASVKPKNQSSSNEKGRMSNVIAKLMGLEEPPLKDGSKNVQKDSSQSKNEGKATNKSSNSKNRSPIVANKKPNQINHARADKDINLDFEVQKNQVTSRSISNPLQQNTRIQAGGVDAKSSPKTESMQRTRIRESNQVAGFQNFKESKKEENVTKHGERRIEDTNTEQQHKSQERLRKPEAEIAYRTIKSNVSVDHLPIRSTDDQEPHQEKYDHPENKRQAEKMPLVKQNLQPKSRKVHQVERIIASKPKTKSTGLQKKQSNGRVTQVNRNSIKQLEKFPAKDLPRVNSRITATKDLDHQSQKPSIKESENEMRKEVADNPLLVQEKPINLAETEKLTTSRVSRNEKHPKIDAVITMRNEMVNRLIRPLKKSATLLQDGKQQKKDHLEEVAIIGCKDSERRDETLGDHSDKLQNNAEQTTILKNSIEDEFNTQKISDMLTPNDSCEDIAPKLIEVMDDYQREDQHEYKRTPPREKQLTESEKHLKEILIKSQSFLKAAEALFKLNLSNIFIQVDDQYCEDTNTKLIFDCVYEIMKRKSWRQEVTMHPCVNTSISYKKVNSFDDLVTQLCKDFEMLKIYVENGNDECDVADYLYKMLDRDINNRDPDVNCVWDFGWDEIMFAFPEQEFIVRDVEKHMINGLLDEITNELLIVNISA